VLDKVWLGFLYEADPGANPKTSEFTYNYLQRKRCSTYEGRIVFFKVEEKICFQNELGYSLRCNFLQRWRCNSRSQDRLPKKTSATKNEEDRLEGTKKRRSP
jgi:hypothetical protein